VHQNDNASPEEVTRAADVLIASYGREDIHRALEQARRIEAATVVGYFARLVREEVERRCSASGDGVSEHDDVAPVKRPVLPDHI
jgi:hypothetical protein